MTNTTVQMAQLRVPRDDINQDPRRLDKVDVALPRDIVVRQGFGRKSNLGLPGNVLYQRNFN